MPLFGSTARRLTLVCVIAGATSSAVARAESPMAPTVLTRESAAEMGARQGPGVAAEHAPAAALRRAEDDADPLLINSPRVTVAAGRRTGSFGEGLELTVTAVQDVPLRAVGRERARLAERLRKVTEHGVQNARLEGAARAALAWADALEAKHILSFRMDSLRDADGLLRIARARVDSGVATPAEIASALAERGTAAALALDAEGILTEALFELRYTVGLTPDAPVEVRGDLEAITHDTLDEAAVVRLAAEHHPALAVASSRAQLASQEARFAYASRAPAVGLGASYLHEGTGNEVWAGVVVLPLPVGDFGAFDRARQEAVADRSVAEVDVVRRRVARDVYVALHERKHARETYTAFVTGAREPLREALRITRAQYEAGPGELGPVLLARQRLASAEEQVAHAAAGVHRADIRVRLASGTLLTGGPR